MVEIDSREPTNGAVANCAGFEITGAADLKRLYPGGYITWFNANLAGRGPFAHRGKIDVSKSGLFDQFWDLIPEAFGKPSITPIEFCALAAVSLEETSGVVASATEECNGQTHAHPGIAYFFDAFGQKSSYNLLGKKVSELLVDPVFIQAHGTLPGSAALFAMKSDPAWASDTWPYLAVPAGAPAGTLPKPKYPTLRDETTNGCVMQADFCKFCGRGIVQTTRRSDYVPVIRFIMTNAKIDGIPTLKSMKAKWGGAAGLAQGTAPSTQQLDTIATASSYSDWETAFSSPIVLANALLTDATNHGNYLALSHDASVLNGGTATIGSLKRMVHHINGGTDYMAEVPPMMFALINATATLIAAQAEPRVAAVEPPPAPDEQGVG